MKSVLIVEDYELLRILIYKVISKMKGFQIIGEAGDGIEALKIINQYKPNIVTLDMGLPHFGGTELLKEIKKRSPNTKIIIISSNEDALEDAKKIGADDFILKPFNNDSLKKVLTRF